MPNAFREAIRGVRPDFTKELDVSDLLLGDLLDNSVIAEHRYDEIRVR